MERYNENVAYNVVESVNDKIGDIKFDVENRIRKRKALDLATTIERINENFVVCDAKTEGFPIIFVSECFSTMTGYSCEELLGQDFMFLSGKNSDTENIKNDFIRKIKLKEEFSIEIKQYRKNGEDFRDIMTVSPISDNENEVQFIIIIHYEKDKKIEGKDENVLLENKNILTSAPILKLGNVRRDHWKLLQTGTLYEKKEIINTDVYRHLKVMSENEPIKLDDFVSIKNIGRGAVGSVSLMQIKGTEFRVALKSINKLEMINRNKVQRTLVENHILSHSDHPFVATCFCTLQTKEHIHYIMEYCNNGNLGDLMMKEPKKRFKEKLCKHFACQILSGLQYLHLQGFINRDIKLDNILVKSDYNILLTDFDLSLITKSEPYIEYISTPRHTTYLRKTPNNKFILQHFEPKHIKANSFVGTEEYIAPEVISGHGHNAVVDWWSFGIILYEMVYGETPFSGRTRRETFDNIKQNDIKFPLKPKVSDNLKDLISKLLVKDYKKRLGYNIGAEEIKEHPFFKDVNWDLLKNKKAPIKKQ
jgi:PAS domain S-box-containing protein